MTRSAAPNVAAAVAIVDELARAGVRHVVLSPGGRSAPLALAVAASRGVRDWIALDERSAGFFALGMARRLAKPVVVLCTSGTAAANLLPAVAEASLSRTPLLVLTADRPPEVRGFGAAQTIDQVDLYGSHVRFCADAPPPSADVDLTRYYRALVCRAVAATRRAPAGPVHLNLPLREPLVPADAWPGVSAAETGVARRRSAAAGEATPVDATSTAADASPAVSVIDAHCEAPAGPLDALAATLAAEERGIVVCGPFAELDGIDDAIADLARRLAWPLLADPLSGVRFDPRTRAAQADAYDLLLRDEAFAAAHRPCAILRFGAVPVSKSLGTLLAAGAPTHVVVTPAGTWPDPWHVATAMVHADAASVVRGLLDRVPLRMPGAWQRAWTDASREVRRAIDERLAREDEFFEGKLAAELVDRLSASAILHVGNSMPVRDLDTFGASGHRALAVTCNRGVNGIDGVLSTALGAAAVSSEPVVLLVGDVSFLHDIGALHLASTLAIDATLVVVDNDGGGMFSFLPHARYGAISERVFGTPHGIDPGPIAQAFGARVHTVEDWAAFREALEGALGRRGLDVVVVRSDRARNLALHQSYVETALETMRRRRGATVSREAADRAEPAHRRADERLSAASGRRQSPSTEASLEMDACGGAETMAAGIARSHGRRHPITHRMEIDGDLVVADEYGTAHADPIVLLHGFTGDRTSWAAIAHALGETHRVVVPDLPGHGETRVREGDGGGDGPNGRHGMAHACRILEGVANELAIDRFTLIGYSMGGRLALHLALALPDRVERLVLESASAGLATAAERDGRRAADEELARFVESHPIEAFVERWESLPLFASQRALVAATSADVRRRRLACRPEGLAASLRGMGTGAQAWLGDRLGELSVPVLLVTGERDDKFAGIGRAMLRSLADASLCVVPGAGHDVHLEAPAAFLDAVRDFLLQGGLECRSSG